MVGCIIKGKERRQRVIQFQWLFLSLPIDNIFIQGQVVRGMASKAVKKYQKELDTTLDSKKKHHYDPSLQKLRIIQHTLVFVSGIPSDLATEKLLAQDLYFGRYGTIKKVIINNSLHPKKVQTAQAYITYQTELQASIAIIALDGLTMEQKPLKASFGTTKYCTFFLKNFQCLNPDCFYLHHYERDNQVPFKSDPKNAFSDNNDYALNTVCNNLQKIIQTITQRGQESLQTDQGFPTRMEMIDFLIDSNLVNSSVIDSLISKCKSANKENSSKQSKKSKSNSFSTIASPSKQQQCAQKKEIEVENIEIETKKQVKVESAQPPKQIQSNPQTTSIKNRRIQEIQKIVEKQLIKQLWTNKKGTNNKSKLNFVDQNANHNEKQLQKIKSIVQKHLIASV